MCELALSAEQHWKKVTASQLVALVRAGVTFKDGVQIATHHTEEPSNQMAQRIAA